MKINTDISYCNKAGILPICEYCKRNVELYEDKDNYKELWWLSAAVINNECKLFWGVR